MSLYTHRAAVLDGFNRQLQFTEFLTQAPGPNEVQVRVYAIALNPFDRIVQTLGGVFTPWLKFPAVIGSDVAGEVIAVGEKCNRIKVGDRIFGLALGVDRIGNRPSEGGFQELVNLREVCCCRLPDRITYVDAATMPLALATAASGLFLKNQLALDISSISTQKTFSSTTPNESVVIWGGATSVGMISIQLAKMAGYRVLSTASPQNHAQILRLGASTVEDYRDNKVIDKLLEATAGNRIAGILAIGAGSGKSCIQLASRHTPRPKVAMASAPISFNGVPIGSQILWRASNFPRLAGGFISMALKAGINNVPTSSIWGTSLVEDPLGEKIFGELAENALKQGLLHTAPQPLIAGCKLTDIPAAMEVLNKGVSARKVVIEILQEKNRR